MLRRLLLLTSLLLTCGQTFAADWQLPPDKGILERDSVAAILKGNDYPEMTGYRKKIDYIDFDSFGQQFTQVVVTLTPDKPRLHNGRKLVVVGGEPGSEYAMDFLETPEGKEGPGIWLAKRGVTFIALTRVGRWNFFAKDGTGSWKDIPIESRMPIFNRQQKAPWTTADFDLKASSGKPATSGDSDVYRFPKQGTVLYNQMLAATPLTYLTGYTKAIQHVLPQRERDQSYLLYWGMSTGGAFLYPLAKYVKPDGYLGWGTSSTGLAYVYRKAKQGDFSTPYTQTALRLRERGMDDFIYYTKELDNDTRQRWWQGALKDPRFKSGEDAPMQFNVAALTETALRLWLSDFLPAEYRQRGLGGFIQDMLEPSFPPAALKDLAVLDMNGTLDEAIPPKTVDAHREAMEPYARKYRVTRVRDFHHYLYTQDSIKTVGSLWLRHIDSGYFDRDSGNAAK
ncbi:MAG: hypothetical protein JWQ21_2023 [Herminiimonas sp.]|nr:hypothetical protein [Herminiimonas sp.]